jgi:hypothetical protein
VDVEHVRAEGLEGGEREACGEDEIAAQGARASDRGLGREASQLGEGAGRSGGAAFEDRGGADGEAGDRGLVPALASDVDGEEQRALDPRRPRR